jgi:hypothetical protein
MMPKSPVVPPQRSAAIPLWINTLLSTLKTSLNGTLHAFNLDQYAR